MRLAVFTSQFPGRVNTFFSRDMRALIEAGLDVDIFPLYPLDPSLWQYVPDILGRHVLPDDRIHHIKLTRVFHKLRPWPLQKLFTYLRDWCAVTTASARFGVEPIGKSAYAILKAWAWARDCGADYDHLLAYWGNYAATCAYVFHRLVDRPIPFSLLLHAGTDLYRNQVFLRQKLLYADNVITVSEFNVRFIQDLYPDISERILAKTRIHHLGLDFGEFPFEPKGRLPTRCVAVGNFDKRKGFDFLLRAIHDIRSRGTDVEVDLIGDGQESESLRRLAKELGISEHVRFRGWLPFNQVRAAMEQSTILVHPSSGLGDGVPTVIKEAMALGTPVIASSIAGIPELLDGGRCGLLVPARDVGGLGDAIKRMLADHMLRQRYAHAARKYAEERFDLWRNGELLADLLRSTARQK